MMNFPIRWFLASLVICNLSVQVISICPPPLEMYVKRGSYLLCRKKYNCLPGHEILSCEENCGEERCVRCAKGKVQPNLIHSDTPDVDRKCFVPRYPNCSEKETGTIETQHGQDLMTCPIADGCACDRTKCFYGTFPCNCDRQFVKCKVNFTLNNDGDCVPCPEGTFKPHSGCESCYKEDPHKQVPVQTKPSPTTTTTTTTTPAPKVPVVSVRPSNATIEESSTSQSTTGKPIVTKTPIPESLPNESGVTMAITITVVAVIAVVIVLIVVAIVIYCLCRNGQFRRFKRRFQRHTERDELPPHVPPREDQHPLVVRDYRPVQNGGPDQVHFDRDVPDRHYASYDRPPVQAEDPASPSSEDCSPLIPPSSPGVNLEEPSLFKVKQQMEEMGKGKISLESQTSVTSSGSVPTPVPDTSPAPGAHPLEDVREYYRSISRDMNPEHLDIHPNIERTRLNDIAIEVPSTNNDEAGRTCDAINVSSSTSAVPASSSTATSYPSAIVSDSIQPIGPNDHRVSAIDPTDTDLATPKIPEQSFVTRSLSSDCADNTPDMKTLEPQQHDEESVTESSMADRHEKGSPVRQFKPSLSDYDSVSELKETSKGGSDS